MKNIIMLCVITFLFSGCDDIFTEENDGPKTGYRLVAMAKKTPFAEEVYYNMTCDYTYDSQNHLSEEKQSNKFYLYDTITTHSDDIIYYDYDGQNRLIKKTTFNLLQLNQSYYYTYEYNTNNRLILERKYTNDDIMIEYIAYIYEADDITANPEPPDILYYWYKKYIDSSGKLKTLEYHDEEGLLWYNSYIYQAGLLKEIRAYNSDNSVNYYRKYLHNSSRILVREEKYDQADALTEYITYEYDSKGIRSRRTQYDSSDNVVSFITYTYEEYQK